MEDEDTGQRIDKWLWFTRAVKTRTLAKSLVERGKVRINRQKIRKPGYTIRPGDVVTFTHARQLHIFKVLDPGTRRGPAPEARLLYEDLSEDGDN